MPESMREAVGWLIGLSAPFLALVGYHEVRLGKHGSALNKRVHKEDYKHDQDAVWEQFKTMRTEDREDRREDREEQADFRKEMKDSQKLLFQKIDKLAERRAEPRD